MARFDDITAEFTPEFINLKDLANELRNVLFPVHDKFFFVGTYKDCNIMYGGMIEAFNKAISRLGKDPLVEAKERRIVLFLFWVIMFTRIMNPCLTC